MTVSRIRASSSSIAASLVRNPAVMPDGTAAVPGLAFASDSDLGIYRPTIATYGGGFGVGVQGKKNVEFYFRPSSLFGFDNAWLILGTDEDVTASGDTYVATIGTPSKSITGAGSAYVGINIGSVHLTSSDQVTKTVQQVMVEVDKIDVHQATNLTCTWNNFVNTRFRFAIPHTNQTIVANRGISFVMPTVSDSGAAVTTYQAVHVPTMSGSGGTNFTGMWFDNTPNKGSISSGDGVDITIVSSTLGSSNSVVSLNGRGSGGRVRLYTNDRLGLELGVIGATQNYWVMDANNTPLLYPGHASTADISIGVSSKGSGAVDFYTSSGGLTQARVLHTASAANTVNMSGAATGANPFVRASAENLRLGTGTVLSVSATAGFIMVPGVGGTPNTAPTGQGTGAAGLCVDTTNNKLYFYSGGAWRDAGP